MPVSLLYLPRVIRLKDAPTYLGMDKNRFNNIVRPNVRVVRMGKQGVAFDRLELDAWWEQYKNRNGCPCNSVGEETWDTKKHPASLKGPISGILTKDSTVKEFELALKQVRSKKPKKF